MATTRLDKLLQYAQRHCAYTHSMRDNPQGFLKLEEGLWRQRCRLDGSCPLRLWWHSENLVTFAISNKLRLKADVRRIQKQLTIKNGTASHHRPPP